MGKISNQKRISRYLQKHPKPKIYNFGFCGPQFHDPNFQTLYNAIFSYGFKSYYAFIDIFINNCENLMKIGESLDPLRFICVEV